MEIVWTYGAIDQHSTGFGPAWNWSGAEGESAVVPREQEPAVCGLVSRSADCGQVSRSADCGQVSRSAEWGY